MLSTPWILIIIGAAMIVICIIAGIINVTYGSGRRGRRSGLHYGYGGMSSFVNDFDGKSKMHGLLMIGYIIGGVVFAVGVILGIIDLLPAIGEFFKSL